MCGPREQSDLRRRRRREPGRARELKSRRPPPSDKLPVQRSEVGGRGGELTGVPSENDTVVSIRAILRRAQLDVDWLIHSVRRTRGGARGREILRGEVELGLVAGARELFSKETRARQDREDTCKTSGTMGCGRERRPEERGRWANLVASIMMKGGRSDR